MKKRKTQTQAKPKPAEPEKKLMTEDDFAEMLSTIRAADQLMVCANWQRDAKKMLSTGMCAAFYRPLVNYRSQDGRRQLEMTSADNIASVCIDIVQGYKLSDNGWDIIGPDQQLQIRLVTVDEAKIQSLRQWRDNKWIHSWDC